MRGKLAPFERFIRLVRISGGCWEWQGAKNKLGYGQFRVDGKRIAPYRFIWEFFNGPMPEGFEPDHLCNNRGCCRPSHIDAVTHAENQRRSYRRGRKRPGVDYVVKERPISCPKGHKYTPENSYFNPKGAISCRECNRIGCHAYQARQRQERELWQLRRK